MAEVYSGDEIQVRRGFWEKVRATLGRVGFLEEAVAAYFCATDARTPAWVKAVLLGALAYFILPLDGVPDFLVALGYTDDLAVLLGALRTVGGHITEDHRAKARDALTTLRNKLSM
jgi:uncharacterized membrane protein YkvA (DUF1232 family)